MEQQLYFNDLPDYLQREEISEFRDAYIEPKAEELEMDGYKYIKVPSDKDIENVISELYVWYKDKDENYEREDIYENAVIDIDFNEDTNEITAGWCDEREEYDTEDFLNSLSDY